MEKYELHIVYKNFTRFLNDFNIELDSLFVLSVSGGKDSMCLYHLFKSLYKSGKIKKFRVIHFNHQLRGESESEAFLVKKTCEADFIECKVVELDIDPSLNNLEKVARDARYNFFQKSLLENEICCLGHHLNDHFEWSMMRFFRSGENDFLRGMPCYRHPFCRPLSYSSVNDIESYVKEHNIIHAEDSSNLDDFADRNYLRNKIVPLISNRFPNYLNFFMHRMKISVDLKTDAQFVSIKYQSSDLEPLYISNNYSIYHCSQLEKSDVDYLKDIIKALSAVKRGSLTREVSKLISAYNHKKIGPMLFSGDVLCWLDWPFMIFYKKNYQENFKYLSPSSCITIQDRESLMQFLIVRAEVEPFIFVNKAVFNNINRKKLRRPPRCFSYLERYENIYSIGSIFSALPD